MKLNNLSKNIFVVLILLLIILLFTIPGINSSLLQDSPEFTLDSLKTQSKELDSLLAERNINSNDLMEDTSKIDISNIFSKKISQPKTDSLHFFKNFTFISKEDVKDLLLLLEQPFYSNYIPQEAKILISNALNINSTLANDSSINNYLDKALINSELSQSFIDSEGIIGRKGKLNLIKISEKFYPKEIGYAVINSKVFVFYELGDRNKIQKLFKINRFNVEDIFETPCFKIITGENNVDKYMVCSASVYEKELWLNVINNINNK
ncbi:MAG: hypothetical protein MJ252_05080 [archaeon]|nr:hypothetical protein [archaeon]